MADPRFKLQVPLLTIDAFCEQNRYQPTIPDPAIPGQTLPNPETKNMFLARKLKEYVEGNAAAGKVIARVNARKTEDDADKASCVLTAPVEIT